MKYELEAVVQITEIPEPHRGVIKRRMGLGFGKVKSFLRRSEYLIPELRKAMDYVWSFIPDECNRVYIQNRSPDA